MINIDPQRNIENLQPVPQVDKVQQRRSDAVRDSNVRQDPATVQISDMGKDFSKAVQKLAQEEEIRPEMLERGRQVLEMWSEPSDAEVDVIANNMVEE